MNRGVTAMADQMLKFRKVIGDRMKEDESLEKVAPVQLENLKQSFEAGWKIWRAAWDNREEEAYNALSV